MTFLLAFSIALVIPLAAVADQAVLGAPDLTCQSVEEWRLHDYGTPGAGRLAFLPQDGNIEVCGVGSARVPRCDLIKERRDAHHPDSAEYKAWDALYVNLCESGTTAFFDGDMEYALGGAYLVASSGDGSTEGGLACSGILGHHPVGAILHVTDAAELLAGGLPAPFTVAADHTAPASPAPPGAADCGDGVIEPCAPASLPSSLPPPGGGVVDTVNRIVWESSEVPGRPCNPLDRAKSCIGSCVVDFAPGADGAYFVFIGSPLMAGIGGASTVASAGHVFL